LGFMAANNASLVPVDDALQVLKNNCCHRCDLKSITSRRIPSGFPPSQQKEVAGDLTPMRVRELRGVRLPLARMGRGRPLHQLLMQADLSHLGNIGLFWGVLDDISIRSIGYLPNSLIFYDTITRRTRCSTTSPSFHSRFDGETARRDFRPC